MIIDPPGSAAQSCLTWTTSKFRALCGQTLGNVARGCGVARNEPHSRENMENRRRVLVGTALGTGLGLPGLEKRRFGGMPSMYRIPEGQEDKSQVFVSGAQ